jgi:hypothetical protein
VRDLAERRGEGVHGRKRAQALGGPHGSIIGK